MGKKITIRTVEIDDYLSKNGVAIFGDDGQPIMIKKPYTTGEMLDEFVWGHVEFSADEAGAICLDRCAERFGAAAEGDEIEIEDADHALIAKKLKEWFPKTHTGQQGPGNRTVRRVRQLVNSFIYGYGNAAKKTEPKPLQLDGAKAPPMLKAPPAPE